jgi:hypothetical protein
MSQSSFQAQVDAWVRKTKERTVAVRNEAAQRVIEAMQEPGPSRATAIKAVAAGAGLGKVRKNGTRGLSKRAFGPIPNPGGSGNLPVDTGFLRASLVTGLAPLSVPTTTPPEDGGSFTWDDDQVTLTIRGADLDDVISCRYAAVYARVAEYGGPGRAPRRFVALAAQKWQGIVADVAREAQAGS